MNSALGRLKAAARPLLYILLFCNKGLALAFVRK